MNTGSGLGTAMRLGSWDCGNCDLRAMTELQRGTSGNLWAI